MGDPSAGGIRIAVTGDEAQDDDVCRCLFFSPLTNNSMAAHDSLVAPDSRPSSRAVSHCFVMCFTLPVLIHAKVLTMPLLSKYAIFWLGTSTIE